MAGLNWAEGLKQTGAGLEGLGAAREKTLELEYRNARDANLNRFKQQTREREDDPLYDTGTERSKLIRENQQGILEAEQQRKDKLTAEQNKREDTLRTEKQKRADEALYDTGSERSKAIKAQKEAELKTEFDRKVKLAIVKSKSKSPMPDSEQEYVDKNMNEWLAAYNDRPADPFSDADSGELPIESITKVEINNAIARFRFQWKATRLSKEKPANVPFSTDENDPDQLRSLIQQR